MVAEDLATDCVGADVVELGTVGHHARLSGLRSFHTVSSAGSGGRWRRCGSARRARDHRL